MRGFGRELKKLPVCTTLRSLISHQVYFKLHLPRYGQVLELYLLSNPLLCNLLNRPADIHDGVAQKVRVDSESPISNST